MPKALDLTNQKFNFLTALKRTANKGSKTYWLCRCDCGFEKEIQTNSLTKGYIKTCGRAECPYYCNLIGESSNENSNLICEICNQSFVSNSPTRKYCFECSPKVGENGVTDAQRISAIRKAMKKQAVKIKGGKCECCGYDKCLAALQFHHRNPEEKSFSLATSGITHSWQEYLNEVMKCDLLCANCHAEKHNADN